MKILFPRAAAIARQLAAISLLCTTSASGQQVVTYYDDMDEKVAGATAPHVLNVPLFAPLFATEKDAEAFWELSRTAYGAPAPDARAVARAFLKERLDIDGDAYVVAHFASGDDRTKGMPDHAQKLTDALMQAFPEHARHTFFAEVADTVGALNSGGEESPGVLALVERMAHVGTAGDVLKRAGAFLWSRTGPGYLYNTFFARGNVIETVREDRRALDEAFGIFHVDKGFTAAAESPVRLAQLVEQFEHVGAFAELPYVKALNRSLESYWASNRQAWTVVARYRFVWDARKAQALGQISQEQLTQVLRAGAAHVPVEGPVTLAQLQLPTAPGAHVRRFDINGYASSDMVRFIAADGSEVLYIPGAERAFVAFENEDALRRWVAAQARDVKSLDDLLLHFSTYNKQDGVFRSGVAKALGQIGSGEWKADNGAIDHSNATVVGDLFTDMQARIEQRMRDDARMEASTAWEAWRSTIARTTTLLAPLGYVPVLALPVQLGSALVGIGTGAEQGIDGRTLEERRSGFGQAVMTAVTSVPLGAAFGSRDGPVQGESPSRGGASLFATPSRINGRIGYPMSPLRAPWWREEEGLGTVGGISPRPPVLDPVEPDEDRPAWTFADGDVIQELADAGYTVTVIPDAAASRVSKVLALKKAEVDERRHRLDDFRLENHLDEHGEWVRNSDGYRTANHSIVYRVDARSPRELLSQGRFGPSHCFYALHEMLSTDATIGSGSLAASNTVFREWNRAGFANREHFNQYAVWTEGREVVSASDNIGPGDHEVELDEVHFPADVPAKDIFIIDSYDPEVQKILAKIIESKHVSTPYGVPLEAFVKYVDGHLDIDAPNEFSEARWNGP